MLLFFLVCLLTISAITTISGLAYADTPTEPDSIYAPYNSFEELYAAYMQAVQDGDTHTQAKLLEIGRTSLQAEIELSEAYAPQPLLDPTKEYWKYQVFPNYFSYGYFEQRDSGVTLSLGNKLSYWSSEDKSNGWTATYIRFSEQPQWDNTEIMKEQFYCHARLVYSAVEQEWNLEPWRTHMDPFTCI